jgi:hypothetical protein
MRVRRHGYLVQMVQVGNPQFPRWLLRDTTNRYWAGGEWITEASKAVLYANDVAVRHDLNQLMLKKPPRRFTATVTITIDPARDFEIAELRDYLRRNVRCRLKSDHGISSLDTACYRIAFHSESLMEDADEKGGGQ